MKNPIGFGVPELLAATASNDDDAIRAAIDKGFLALVEERDDWREPHVSDVYGCDYATHARRGADTKPTVNRDPQGALKMALGNDVERYACAGLEAYAKANGYGLERGERLAWNPTTGAVRRGLLAPKHAGEPATAFYDGEKLLFVPCQGCDSCQPRPGEMIGHVDAVLVGEGETLFEIKSTSLYGRAVASLPWTLKDGRQKGVHYIEQAATYGVAIGAARVGVIIADRESGNIHGPFWLELDAPPPNCEGIYDPAGGTLREQTIARAKQMLEATDPEAFPPDPKPRYAWQPEYCSLGDACACRGKV